MGLPGKLLADGERPLVVLRPHIRRLVRPALILLLLAPVATFADAVVPRGSAQTPARLVIAGLAAVMALRWVVLPYLLWWNTVYVLTDERVFDRQGIVRRSGHDLPLRRVTDVVVAQKLGDRLLRSGTLTVTTDGGRDLVFTDVPAVVRLQRSMLAVADRAADRDQAAYEERWGHGTDGLPGDDADDLDGLDHAVEIDEDREADVHELGGRVEEELAGAAHAGWVDHRWGGTVWEDDGQPGPSRREARRRDRESTRRLRAIQAEVRRAPRPDSPLEDDGAEPRTVESRTAEDDEPDERPDEQAGELPDEQPDERLDERLDEHPHDDADQAADAEETQGARILRFPRRP